MVLKSINITEIQEKWLKGKSKKLGLTEADIVRRILDKEISAEKSNE